MNPEGDSEGSGVSLIELGWLTAAFLVPVVVNPWGHNPFVPIKVSVLRSLAWAMLVVWALETIRAPTERRIRWHSPIAAPGAILAAVMIAATLFGVNPMFSVWGSAVRGQGLLTLLSYCVLGGLVAANLDRETSVRRLVGVIAWSAVPLVVIGVFQALGYTGGLVSDARSPVFATLGRSNFLGAYLAMVLPLTLVWTTIAKSRPWRVAAGVLALLEVGVLLLSHVRAAWMASAVGVVVLLLVARPERFHRWCRNTLARAVALAGGVGVLAGGVMVARAGESGEARLAIWQGCQHLFFERPLFGYGPDALALVFPRVYPADLVYHQGRWAAVDRAHSWPLDLMISLGLAGLAAFVAVLVVALLSAWRELRKDGAAPAHQLVLAAVVAGVVANLVANLLSFDVTATATLLWVFLGIMAAAPLWTRSDNPPESKVPIRGRSVMAAVTAAVILVVMIVAFNARQVVSDAWIRRAETAMAAGEMDAALEANRRAIEVWPREADWYRLRAELIAGQFVAEGGDDQRLLVSADTFLAQAIRRQPQRFDLWLARGRIAVLAFQGGVIEAADAANGYFRRAAELAPQHAIVPAEWAHLDWAMGQLAQAEEKLRKTVDLDNTSAGAWSDLGRLQLQRGRLDESGHSFNRALGLDAGLLSAWLGSAMLHLRLGDQSGAREVLESARALAPDHPEVKRLNGLLDRPLPAVR